MSHRCKNVTCILKWNNSDDEREEGLLHNHHCQWLIIIIMRQISRPTGGLYEPPTLHIYIAFSLLLLPTSSVWPFRSSFRASTQICNIFSLHFLSLLLPLPAFTPVAFPFPFFPKLLSFCLLFFSFWALTCITAGQSNDLWSELKEMAISGGIWQQVKPVHFCRNPRPAATYRFASRSHINNCLCYGIISVDSMHQNKRLHKYFFLLHVFRGFNITRKCFCLHVDFVFSIIVLILYCTNPP